MADPIQGNQQTVPAPATEPIGRAVPVIGGPQAIRPDLTPPPQPAAAPKLPDGVEWGDFGKLPVKDGKIAGRFGNIVDAVLAFGEADRKIGEHGNLIGELRKQLTEMQKGFEAVSGERNQHAASVQGLQQQLQRLQSQAGQAASQTAHADETNNWESFDPQGYGQQVVGFAVKEALRQVQEGWQAEQARLYDYMHNLLRTAVRTVDIRFRNPEAPIDKILEQVQDIQSGKMDPFDLATRMVSAPQEMAGQVKSAVEQAVAEARAQWEKERAAAMPPSTAPVYVGARGIGDRDSRKQDIINEHLRKFPGTAV